QPAAGRSPLVPLIRAGEIVHRPTLAEIREHAAAALASLPPAARDVAAGDAYLTVDQINPKEQ
ncbi:MAG TPA: hypothetical protein VN088_14005, partial [Nocardioides sp.]|nr:hypothetical protein [Nocardioides sp.]